MWITRADYWNYRSTLKMMVGEHKRLRNRVIIISQSWDIRKLKQKERTLYIRTVFFCYCFNQRESYQNRKCSQISRKVKERKKKEKGKISWCWRYFFSFLPIFIQLNYKIMGSYHLLSWFIKQWVQWRSPPNLFVSLVTTYLARNSCTFKYRKY